MRKTIALITFILVSSIFGISAQTKSSAKKQNTEGGQTNDKNIGTETKEGSKQAPKDENTVYNIVSIEKTPEFPGGIDSLLAFISRNVMYPQAAIDNNIQGRVYIKFVVEKNGHVSNVELYKSNFQGNDMGCIREAIRVVKLLPDFSPGIQNGKPVRVAYQIPISFKLANGPVKK